MLQLSGPYSARAQEETVDIAAREEALGDGVRIPFSLILPSPAVKCSIFIPN